MITIYKIVNLKNYKKYIGKTINFKERTRQHKQTSFNKNSPLYYYPLYVDMRKFGLNNFKFEIIEEVDDNLADEKEIFWIDFYKSCIDFGNGYNLDLGGEHGFKSEYTKEKMRKANIGSKNPSYGKRGKDSCHAIKVINVTKNIIYPSMIDCAIEEYGDKKYLKQISKVCDEHSNRQSYKGNVYRKINEDGNIINKSTAPVNKAFNPVRIVDLISGKEFNSISETSKFFDISNGMVRDRIYGRVKNDKFKTLFDLKILE